MKVSVDWLRDHVDFNLKIEELSHLLTMCGLNCEGIEEHGDDHVLELEVTSNRPDHLGHRGFARELSCLLKVPLKPLDLDFDTVDATTSGLALDEVANIVVDDEERCGRYTARVAEGVKISESPEWIRRRLEAIGLRPINLVVDLTNYVLMDLGQPLHAFDLDRLEGGEVIVRRAQRMEKFSAIDGSDHELDSEDLVIADQSGTTALAGIMGGTRTEVHEGTQRILLESAWFEPVPVRSSSRRLILASDSSYRFERRLDVEACEIASRRFMHLLARESDCSILSGCLEVIRDGLLDQAEAIAVRPQKASSLLGDVIPEGEISSILSALGFHNEGTDDSGPWTPPTWRVDCSREADLIEEIGRIRGLDQMDDRRMEVRAVPENARADKVERVHEYLVGASYHEAMTISFGVAEGDFQPIENWWNLGEHWVVRNPIRAGEGSLRKSLIPGLLSSVRGNRTHGVDEVRLFEVANVFHRRDGVDRPVEKNHVAWVLSRSQEEKNLQSYREVRGVADGILDLLRVAESGPLRPSWSPVGDGAGFIPGSTAALSFSGEQIGLVGKVDADDLGGETWYGELDLGYLLDQSSEDVRFSEFSRHPVITRDLNFVVSYEVLWRDLSSEIDAASLEHLESRRFIDMYRGKQVGQGRKSMTFSLTFRAANRTLTHEEIDQSVEKLVGRLGEKLQAELRS